MAPLSVPALRAATQSDVAGLGRLIARSARALGRGFHSEEETEAAIAHVFGVDSELVADGSYRVATVDGELAGCGGWSRACDAVRGDRFARRDSGVLDPATDAARIRAFFVAPAHVRQGVGAASLVACENAARGVGFQTAALMARLPGAPFYTAFGYHADKPVALDLDGVAASIIFMSKHLAPRRDARW